METKIWPIALALCCAVMGSLAQLLFKLGSASLQPDPWTWLSNIKVLGGMGLYGISAILFIVALKHGNLSVLYPVIATSYVWVTLISFRVLHEPVSIAKFLGIALILCGVMLIVKNG
ncbi:MAG: EamA family transporter [Desulfoferrobacter sp.]